MPSASSPSCQRKTTPHQDFGALLPELSFFFSSSLLFHYSLSAPLFFLATLFLPLPARAPCLCRPSQILLHTNDPFLFHFPSSFDIQASALNSLTHRRAARALSEEGQKMQLKMQSIMRRM
jgi:hypothetical protein